MRQIKLAGPGAAALKYDVITALGAYALSLKKHDQRRILRLITLMTARYNWARDELTIGQREIGALWSCDPRTVKRELAHLRARGWVVTKSKVRGAGVATYGLQIDKMFEDTRPIWSQVGPDFEVRLDTPPTETIVPFPSKATAPLPPTPEATEWGLARAVLYQEDQSRFGAWLQALTRAGRAGGRLTLKAPSRFHAAYVQTHLMPVILTACQSVDPEISTIEISD